jgi:hypothetical protein
MRTAGALVPATFGPEARKHRRRRSINTAWVPGHPPTHVHPDFPSTRARHDVLRCSEDRVRPWHFASVCADAVFRLRSNAEVSHPMRLLDRRTGLSPALLLRAFACALGALPGVAAAQPWSPLVREYRGMVVADVYFDAQAVREIEPGRFEIRLMYEPVTWACVRRDRDGDCDVEPGRLLTSRRITVIRIRCWDMSYEEVTVWVAGSSGSWQQVPLLEFRHPPGWRYDIGTSTAVAAARDLVCATVPP